MLALRDAGLKLMLQLTVFLSLLLLLLLGITFTSVRPFQLLYSHNDILLYIHAFSASL